MFTPSLSLYPFFSISSFFHIPLHPSFPPSFALLVLCLSVSSIVTPSLPLYPSFHSFFLHILFLPPFSSLILFLSCNYWVLISGFRKLGVYHYYFSSPLFPSPQSLIFFTVPSFLISSFRLIFPPHFLFLVDPSSSLLLSSFLFLFLSSFFAPSLCHYSLLSNTFFFFCILFIFHTFILFFHPHPSLLFCPLLPSFSIPLIFLPFPTLVLKCFD